MAYEPLLERAGLYDSSSLLLDHTYPTPLPHEPPYSVTHSCMHFCIHLSEDTVSVLCSPDINSSLFTPHSVLTLGFHTCCSLFLTHRSPFPPSQAPINSLLFSLHFLALMPPAPQSGSDAPLELPQPPGPPHPHPQSLGIWVTRVWR